MNTRLVYLPKLFVLLFILLAFTRNPSTPSPKFNALLFSPPIVLAKSNLTILEAKYIAFSPPEYSHSSLNYAVLLWTSLPFDRMLDYLLILTTVLGLSPFRKGLSSTLTWGLLYSLRVYFYTLFSISTKFEIYSFR